jgi:hypothetical protein
VTVQDAKHKLAYAASTPWWPQAVADTGNDWTYALRKKLSVLTTRAFLEAAADGRAAADNRAFAATFASARKKDDLADSLLQAMAYCHNVRCK